MEKTFCDACGKLRGRGHNLKFTVKRWFSNYCDLGWEEIDICDACFKGLQKIKARKAGANG